MTRRRRIWAAVTVLTLYFAFNFVAALFAGTRGTNCAPSDTANTRVWENEIGDDTDGNDVLNLCGSNYPNLHNISHTLPGGCHDSGLGRGDWGDCASSVSTEVPAGQRLCLYNNSGYSGLVASKEGPQFGARYNIPGDVVSSLKITSGSC